MNKLTKILITDDDADDQQLLKEVLHSIDDSIECVSAYNGEEALHLLEKLWPSLPDFMFLDLNMPRVNGIQCLSLIKKSEKLRNMPVIIYTTTSEKKYIEQTTRLGAVHYLIKPVNMQLLHEQLMHILFSQEQRVNRVS